MRGYKSPPTDPDLWAKDAADLGLAPSEITYSPFAHKIGSKSSRNDGGWELCRISEIEANPWRDYSYIAEPIDSGKQFEVTPSVPERQIDPIFGQRDRKFVLTFHRVAREMEFDVALTTPKLLYRIDFNRFDGKMPMTKAIRAALTSYNRFPEWFK